MSQSKQQFAKNVLACLSQVFGFSVAVFYFIESEELVQYSGDSLKKFSIDFGLAGLAAKQQKGYIINDIRNSSYFNESVDIKSILPVYALPILEEI